jgi:serine/threonine protein kinase
MVACPARAELRLYLTQDDSLGPGHIETIEAHVETCPTCQAVLNGLSDDEIPSGTTTPSLPGYCIYRHLGSGAFGEVWLAQDLNLSRVVAAKTLNLGRAPKGQARALDALRQDAQLLARVEHPNVVRVYAWLTVQDHHYLVMQYVSGGSLADLLKSDGPLDWQRAARYVADVGEGLLEVHGRGIVHRDVKPANILWDPHRDEAVLTDFGVAARLADPADIGGSIPYMAPEAFDGRVSFSLDVYSLASTLFELVTGVAPFAGSRISDLKEQIRRGLPDPDPRCAGLPEPLERIIRSGLSADPGRRPKLKEFVSMLRGTLNQLMADTFTMSLQPAGSVPSTIVSVGSGPKPSDEPTTEQELPRKAPVDLRLIVSRQVGPQTFIPVISTHPRQPTARPTRDMRKVPPSPDQVRLRTGDRVRIEVSADRAGFLTVFNVGPTGTLNLLFPDGDPQHASPPPLFDPNRPLHIVEVEMTPPAGRERLVAVWSREPLRLRLDQLRSIMGDSGGSSPASRPYVATRDMKRVQQSVQQLRLEDRHAVVMELDHVAGRVDARADESRSSD